MKTDESDWTAFVGVGKSLRRELPLYCSVTCVRLAGFAAYAEVTRREVVRMPGAKPREECAGCGRGLGTDEELVGV